MFPGAGCSSEHPSPLASPSYFKSPVNTLLASLEDAAAEDQSVHDLIDAYCIFSFRIQAVQHLLCQEDTDRRSFQYVKANSTALARCIQRDIRRAFTDPLAGNFSSLDPQTLATASYPTFNISEENASLSRSVSLLCQQALLLASNIFYFNSLHSLFPDSILHKLLDDILVIARTSELPTVDGDKTRLLATWIFSTLRLPARIVNSSKDTIQGWLDELTASLDCQQRASDVIHHMLSRYPHTFFEGCAKVLPDVLNQLASTNPSMRMDAAVALAGYTLAFLSISPSAGDPSVTEMHSAVYTFIRAHLPRSQPVPRNSAAALLSDYLTRAAGEDLSRTDGQGPRWAITVICCLTVLSGQGIFTGTRPFKLVVSTLESISKHKGDTATLLVAWAWRCLVWAFFQIPRNAILARASRDDVRPRPSQREAAFGLVRQDLRGGVGACLVAGLVSNAPVQDERVPRPASDVDLIWALSVLKDMIVHSRDHVYEDGLILLGRLVSGIGKPTEPDGADIIQEHWNPNVIVVRDTLSRHILRADAQKFSVTLKAAAIFDASVVRPLSEGEIVSHWDALVEIWVKAIERELRRHTSHFTLRDVLVQTWQALLLVQTQLTQEQGHLTATHDFATKAVSIIAQFMEWNQQPAGASPSASSIEDQNRVLSLCGLMWTTMCHVFSESWLSAAAESLLTSVLKHTFNLSDERVKTSWSQLCSSLVSAGAPMLMARLVVEDEAHGLVDIKRELWRVAAQQWTSMTPRPSWHDSLDFVAIALRCWTMDSEEIAVWGTIVDNALAVAALESETPLSVLDSLMDGVPDDITRSRLVELPTVAQRLLSHLRVTEDIRPPAPFLRHINTLLCDLYSRLPERVAGGLQTLKSMRHAVRESTAQHIVGALAALSDGLALWVGDKDELLLDAEYNDVVIPLYRDILETLRQVKITPELLSGLAHLLYSAFIRVPAPGHGPIAFCDFWVDIEPSLKDMRDSYPEEIKIAWRACRDVLGGASFQDLSLDSDSHSGSQPEVSPMKSDSLTSQSASAMRARILELQKTPTPLRQRNVSPTVSPEVPFELPPSTGIHAHESSTTPTRRTREDFMSSDFMPSSPTDAVRARRLAMRPTSRVAHERAAKPMERPLKRRKVDSSPRMSKKGPPADSPTTPNTSRRSSTRTKSLLESPDIEPKTSHGRKTTRKGSTTPRRVAISKGKQVASTPMRSSPVRAAPTVTPSSDDYDAWEAPILEDGVPQLSDDERIVPDSQPSDAEGEDESLLPSYMKTTGRRRDDFAAARSDDTMIVDDCQAYPPADSHPIPTTKTQGKTRARPHPGSPVRMHTAPASLQPSHSHSHSPSQLEPEEAGHPLRRARTASAQLEELRNVYDALREEGSQLPLGEIAAASELTNKLGAMLSEKLSRRLRGGGGGNGEGSSKEKGKGRG